MFIGLGTAKGNSNMSFIVNVDIVSDINNIVLHIDILARSIINYFVFIGDGLSDSISSNVNSTSYTFCMLKIVYLCLIFKKMRSQGCHIKVGKYFSWMGQLTNFHR